MNIQEKRLAIDMIRELERKSHEPLYPVTYRTAYEWMGRGIDKFLKELNK